MNPLWTDLAARANVALSADQHARLARYLDLLLEANEVMNLTRITDRDKAELLHVADALTILPFLPAGPHKLADLGSGGGVPGIPLAIARPDATVLLVESTKKKKASYLRQTVEELGLANVEVSELRAEDLGRSYRRGTFDVVTARAVALLPWLVEWALPLLKKGGSLLAMKGERAAAEIHTSRRARRLLLAAPPVVHPAPLPGNEGHVIVQIAKEGPTGDGYPRPPTTAKGRPL